jgi:hypothetical protein
MVPFILKSDSLSMFPAGEAPVVIDVSHMNFKAVVDAIKAGDFETAVALATVKGYVETNTQGLVTVSDQGVTYKGQPINGYLTEKMMTFFREGLPVDHYCKFLANLMDNPSMVSRKELSRLWSAIGREGMTLVPLKWYFNDRGMVKVKLGIAKGKKVADKRETSAKRDWDRQQARLLKQGNRD